MADENWRDAPPPKTGQYDWTGIVRRLKQRPGKWVMVAEQVPRSIHGSIVRGRISALRDEKWVFECRTRNTTDGKLADIWMSARRKTEEDK